MEIPKKWKKIKVYGIAMPDGLMLEFKKYRKEINQPSGNIFKVIKVEIKVIKIFK